MWLDKIDVHSLKEHLWNLASDESISIFEIETFLRNFFKRKPLSHSEAVFEFYCRCSLNEKDQIFKSVDRCSYNPFISKIELQRCNYDEQQVFYAAVPVEAKINCVGTALLEVSWEHISNLFLDYYFVTLSRWRTTRNLKVFLFPDLQPEEAIAQGVNTEKDLRTSEKVNDEDIPYFLAVMKLFKEILGTKENKKVWYRISSAFYNCIMRFGKEENLMIDGMVYSSANSEKLGTNIVLNKELIDNDTLYCDYVRMYIARRNYSDPTDIWSHPVSDGVQPKADKTFEIKLYPEFIEKFKNAPPLDLSAITE